MRIAICGPPGSGTTTVAKLLAQRLGYELISVGQLFRELASARKLDLIQFSKLAEQDSSIDLQLDQLQKQLAQAKPNLVVEGRLSWFFTDADLKIYLKAPLEVRAARVASRDGISHQQALEQVKLRESSEAKRYLKYYGLDPNDLSKYDLVIETSNRDPESIVNIILAACAR